MDALRRRMLVAMGLGSGCASDPADEVWAPPLAAPQDAEPLVVGADTGEALDAPDPSAEPNQPRIVRANLAGVWTPGHLAVVEVEGARPGAPVVFAAGLLDGPEPPATLLDAASVTEIARARADAHGRATLRFRLPDAARQVVVVDVLTNPVVQRAPFPLIRKPVDPLVPNAVLAHPGRGVDGFVEGHLIRACRPTWTFGDGTSCPDPTSFGFWDRMELVAYGFGQPLAPDLTLNACGEEDGYLGSCCYVLQVFDDVGRVPDQCIPIANRDDTDAAPELDTGLIGWGSWYGMLGRPLTTDDGARVATSVRAGGWADRPRDVELVLDPETRAAAAAAWVRAGLAEHASVASFARFTLHLLALGAPADLVARASRAQADEVRHAAEAFEVATAFGGEPVAPGPLPLDGVLAGGVDLHDVVRAAVVEGCVLETVSAAQVAAAGEGAADPGLAGLLARTARDEEDHAALAWAFVRWALRAHPEVRPTVAEAFAEMVPPSALPEPDALDEALTMLGVLSARDAHRVACRVHDEVIRPCAAALLADA